MTGILRGRGDGDPDTHTEERPRRYEREHGQLQAKERPQRKPIL